MMTSQHGSQAGREGLEWEDKQFGRETDLSLRICLFGGTWTQRCKTWTHVQSFLIVLGLTVRHFSLFFIPGKKTFAPHIKLTRLHPNSDAHIIAKCSPLHPQKVPEIIKGDWPNMQRQAFWFWGSRTQSCKEFTNWDTRTLCSHLHTHLCFLPLLIQHMSRSHCIAVFG